MDVSRPIPDGWIKIQFLDGSGKLIYFNEIPEGRGWRWSDCGGCGQMLIVPVEGGRYEFPMANIKNIQLRYNSDRYKKKLDEWWEVQHVQHLVEGRAPFDCPKCTREKLSKMPTGPIMEVPPSSYSLPVSLWGWPIPDDNSQLEG